MKSSRKDRDALISAATSAYRKRNVDGQIDTDPAWLDLDVSGRIEAFEVTSELRRLEAGTDPLGLSSTARAVLQRLRR